MDVKYIIDKLVMFFFNLSVAGFAVALFQDKGGAVYPATSALGLAIGLALLNGMKK